MLARRMQQVVDLLVFAIAAAAATWNNSSENMKRCLRHCIRDYFLIKTAVLTCCQLLDLIRCWHSGSIAPLLVACRNDFRGKIDLHLGMSGMLKCGSIDNSSMVLLSMVLFDLWDGYDIKFPNPISLTTAHINKKDTNDEVEITIKVLINKTDVGK